eukprot:9884886-Heterocapsa_arctica.AAC.1
MRPDTPTLPDGFLRDVRSLEGATTVHFRDRLASCLADCVEGMTEGDTIWGILLESYPKLILHSIPYGISAIVELEQRLALWEQGIATGMGLTTLLHRINLQEEAKNRDGDKETEGEKRSKRAARAKRLASEGALSKA